MHCYQWGQFQSHGFHVVPSLGPIISVMTLHGRQTHPRADQSAKPGHATVYG